MWNLQRKYVQHLIWQCQSFFVVYCAYGLCHPQDTPTISHPKYATPDTWYLIQLRIDNYVDFFSYRS